MVDTAIFEPKMAKEFINVKKIVIYIIRHGRIWKEEEVRERICAKVNKSIYAPFGEPVERSWIYCISFENATPTCQINDSRLTQVIHTRNKNVKMY